MKNVRVNKRTGTGSAEIIMRDDETAVGFQSLLVKILRLQVLVGFPLLVVASAKRDREREAERERQAGMIHCTCTCMKVAPRNKRGITQLACA